MMKTMKWVGSTLLNLLDNALFPGDVTCLCCERALREQAQDGVCMHCQRALDRLSEADLGDIPLAQGLVSVQAMFPYREEAKTLIGQLKYRHVREAAVPLGRSMAYLPSGEEEVLVPIPTDIHRARARGFNQAVILAEVISREIGMEMCVALKRTCVTKPQVSLSEEQRRKNLVGCMAVKPDMERHIRGKWVLLVDDVYTTGATAQEAARALLTAGAKKVSLFVAARAGGMEDREDPFGRHGAGKTK